MSQPYEHIPTLHQQEGGMSVEAFAALQGISLATLRYYVKSGRVIGAQQDARSKKWTIYPPAKLIDKAGDSMKPRSYKKRSAASIDNADCVGLDAECSTQRAAPPSGAGVMDACGHADTHPTQAVIEAAEPLPAKPVLILGAAALPVPARSVSEDGAPARSGKPEVYTESRSVCQALREAAARQHREGIHYLRLDAHEFAQLYAALNSDRSRVRKLVGRGLLPVGLLRASDSVWQKMQAMSQQGRLL